MFEKNVSKWIEEVIVPGILKNEDFRDTIVTRTEIRGTESMKDNFASEMFEINLQIKRMGKNEILSFLLKVMCGNEKVREKHSSDKQFFNEIHLYSTIMPTISSHISSPQIKKDFESLVPKCYYSFYAHNKKPDTFEDAVLVMENLKIQNYKLGDRGFLDLKHCLLAFKRIGLFHACSYFMKERDPKLFTDLVVNQLKETYYDSSKRESNNGVFGSCEQRVIDGLAAEVPDDDAGLIRLRQLASRDAHDVFVESVQHREPLSVLCHGDFLRNNVLFRYEAGAPVDMRFVDFQMARYASPAVDLSLFLCMNTSHHLRAAHFDRLLQAYHHSLTDTLAALCGQPKEQLDPRYSFESFLADFRQNAVNGYLITIEFLPWMLASEADLAEIVKLNFEERGSPRYNEAARRLGGEAVTRVLVDLAKDLLRNNCL